MVMTKGALLVEVAATALVAVAATALLMLVTHTTAPVIMALLMVESGCCGYKDGAGANSSNKGADCSIAGKEEVLVPPLEQQENTKEGPSLHSIVPRKSCWCPHDTSLNQEKTSLGM